MPADTEWTRARERYADKMRRRGTPLMITEEEFRAAARLLEKAHAYGMSDRMIFEQTGFQATAVSKIRNGRIRTLRRSSYERLAGLRPQRAQSSPSPTRGKVVEGAYRDPTGTLRRIRALRADGFPGRLLGERLGVSYEAVGQLARGRTAVLESTRLDVAGLYDSLDGRWPAEFGVTRYAVGKCATYARRAGYAPRSCWDSDTIDDPDARPEWTGRCGTVFGWHIHQTEGIPPCPPCIEAHSSGSVVFSGELFRQFREREGLSRVRLARKIGVNASTIQYWETGRSLPTRQNKLDLALRVLDVTLEEVCEQEVEPHGR